MERNELVTLTHRIVTQSFQINTNQDDLKNQKQENREQADRLVNWFIDNDSIEGLVNHLTDCYEAMDSEGVFGIRGVKTKSGADYVTIRKNASAKFFHRSFNSLDIGLTLSGYAPFLLKETEPKVVLTDEEKLVECLEEIGADITCIGACKSSLSFSVQRKEARLIEQTKAVVIAEKAAKADADLIEQNQTIDKLLALMGKGLTIADIEKMATDKQEAEQA